MTSVRLIIAAIFVAIMFGWYQITHFVVGLGFIPWLLLMIAVFRVGLLIENRERYAEGLPPYSWYDAGRDAREVWPVVRFWIIVVAATFVLTRLI